MPKRNILLQALKNRRLGKRNVCYRVRKKRAKPKTAKAVYKIATQAAHNVLKKEADPNWQKQEYGSYDTATGQWSNAIEIVPGPDNGYIDDSLPKILLPAELDDLGLPGTRKDQMVDITGISCRLRVFIPHSLKGVKLVVYLAQDKTGVALTKLFNTPDQVTMLRETDAIRSDLAQINILQQKVVQIRALPTGANNPATEIFKDISLWHKFKTPFKLKFTGDGTTDYLNRRFCFCVKASYQFPTDPNYQDDRISFVGHVTTYYRDL